jgi:glutamyl-tRNA reductase
MTGPGIISGASVSHENAAVEDLERATVAGQREGVERLMSVEEVDEAFVLQTCNRVEAYVVSEEEADGQASLEAFFEDASQGVLDLLDHEESLHHLMRVAAGLESLIVGEDQILGQLRAAYEDARQGGGVGPVLEQGVTKAIHLGERARTETAINEGSVSLASAAVSLAETEGTLADDPEALVVGAGEMGQLTAESLAESVDRLHLANRTVERAAEVASQVDAETAVHEVEALAPAVEVSSVVVSATDSNDQLIDAAMLRDTGGTFVVDIAKPRDVDPAADDLPEVTVHDLDSLRSVTDENRKRRAAAAASVEEMIDVEFEHLLAQYKRKRADDVISAMYESAERVKARELETAFETGEFDEADREVVEAMADAVVNQILAAPTKSLRDAAEQDDWSTINTALQLFDPEFGPERSPVAMADDPAIKRSSDTEQLPDGLLEEPEG